MSRWLIALGLVLVTAGFLWPIVSRLGLGKLPGDIVIRREGVTIYLPVMASLVVSLVVSVLIWIFRR